MSRPVFMDETEFRKSTFGGSLALVGGAGGGLSEIVVKEVISEGPVGVAVASARAPAFVEVGETGSEEDAPDATPASPLDEEGREEELKCKVNSCRFRMGQILEEFCWLNARLRGHRQL